MSAREFVVWNNNLVNSIINDFDDNSAGNQTVNNNFFNVSLRSSAVLSQNGVIYGFDVTDFTVAKIDNIALTEDVEFLPLKYRVAFYVYGISGSDITALKSVNEIPSDTITLSIDLTQFQQIRVLVTVVERYTNIPIAGVLGYRMTFS